MMIEKRKMERERERVTNHSRRECELRRTHGHNISPSIVYHSRRECESRRTHGHNISPSIVYFNEK